jgi:O-antigen ligase
MKNWILSTNKKDAIIGLLIILFFATILKQQLPDNSKVIILIVAIVSIIFRFRFDKKLLLIYGIAFLPYLVLHVVYIFFDTPPIPLAHSITTKVSFIAFALLLSQIPFLYYPSLLKKFANILTGFLFFLFGFLLYYAILSFAKNQDWGIFFYSAFAGRLMHTGYFSNFFLFSFLYFYFSFIKKNRLIYLIIALVLVGMLVLIACKTAYLCLFIFTVIEGVKWVKKIKKTTNKILLLVAILLSGFIIYNIPPIQNRLKELFNTNKVAVKNVNTNHSSPIRKLIWKSEWEIIKRNPIIGYGTGAVDSLLVIEYKKNNYTYLLDNVTGSPLHSHNQFLHQWIDQGILGILSLLFLLGYCFWFFVKNNFDMGAWWIVFMSLVIFTDDVLEIHVCVVFIALTISLLIWHCQANHAISEDI